VASALAIEPVSATDRPSQVPNVIAVAAISSVTGKAMKPAATKMPVVLPLL